VAHIFIHRHAPVYIAYVGGALLLLIFGMMGFVRLPWSSGLLFILLSCTAILFYIAISLGTELPTSIILESFTKKKEQSLADLTTLFTDRGLILNRVDDLVQSGLVSIEGGKLTVTGRGKIIRNIMEVYKLVFNRSLTE
jgi:hypothetical protein